MTTRRIAPPWDYLHDASGPSLESFALSRLNHAANIRREIEALIDQWVEDTAQALLAQWVREDRAITGSTIHSVRAKPQAEFAFTDAVPSPRMLRSADRTVKFARRPRPMEPS
jgi:hypothetical protein